MKFEEGELTAYLKKQKSNKTFFLSLYTLKQLEELSKTAQTNQGKYVSDLIDADYKKKQSKLSGMKPDAIFIDEYPSPNGVNELMTGPIEKITRAVQIKDLPKNNEEINLKNAAPREIYDYYMSTFDKDDRYKLTQERKAVIQARLDEGFSVEECKRHIDFIRASDFHMGNNDGNKMYIDLKDIIFHKNKFHKRIDEMKNFKPKAEAKELTEEEMEADFQKRLEEYQNKLGSE